MSIFIIHKSYESPFHNVSLYNVHTAVHTYIYWQIDILFYNWTILFMYFLFYFCIRKTQDEIQVEICMKFIPGIFQHNHFERGKGFILKDPKIKLKVETIWHELLSNLLEIDIKRSENALN